MLSEINLARTLSWNSGFLKWIKMTGDKGLVWWFCHALVTHSNHATQHVCSGEIDVVELYHQFPSTLAATMRSQGMSGSGVGDVEGQ